MAEPKLLNAEPCGYSLRAKQVLETFARVEQRAISQSELERQVCDFELLIVRLGLTVNQRVLEAGTKLRAVATATTGLDHIDLETARSRGIAVLSLRGEEAFLESVPASSEHTWALLLALTRRIVGAFDSIRRGEWDRDAHRGRDLWGRRLAIVGLGRIGRRVAEYGLAFGMSVSAFDPYRKTPWPSRVEAASSLERLLRGAEVLSLHVPLVPETENLIGRRELRMMPPGSLLVNSSRGGVVDIAAVLDALHSGQLAGAALDVLPGEPFASLEGHPVLEYVRAHENLIVTPHLAGATWESMEKTELFMAEKLKSWWLQRPATNTSGVSQR